ncbi:MAG: DUF4340 domain-containing protein [Verrucomicrobiae bacterium]|nr:DUF4340 domain-containing protein [Verrucomicrobiae bacterium]NNJ87338.1 DUF4340 domain-containing protein [Akkermansiaceae bacterium]
MRYSFTIILAVFALILGGLAVVFMGSEYRNAIFGVPPVPPGQQLFDVKELDQVTQITLTNTEGGETNFVVDGHQWKATKPWNDRADPIFIKFLIQFTARLKVEEVIPRKDLDLSKFGLKQGHIRVTMRNSKGTPICDYRIGRPAAWHIPSDDGKTTTPTIYIRMVDNDLEDDIYVCSEVSASSIHSLFQNQFARFRDHHPFHFSPKYLDRVRVQSNEGEVVISRKDLKSAWGISKPLELRVDPTALNTLFKDMAKLTALNVEDRASVTLPTAEDNTAQARELAIHFAGAEDETVLRIYPPAKEDDTYTLATVSDRPDAVFQLPLTAATAIPGTSSLSQLQIGVNDLRSKTMTHLNGPQLKTIIIRPEGRTPIMLQRTKQTTWRVLRRNGWEEANQDAVIDLMMAVTRDKVQKFVTDAATELKPYGLDRPFLQLGFLSFNNQGMRISFGRDAKTNHIYAHIVGRHNIWQISDETLSKIAQNSWQWRTSHIWHLPKQDIQKINIQKVGEPSAQLGYDHFAAKWTAQRGNIDATARLNPNRANKLITHLESLKTRKWIGPMHPQAMQALKQPEMIISITINRVDDQGREMSPLVKTLRIKGTPGGLIYFGKVDTTPSNPDRDGENSYFLLDPETVKKLSVDLFE